MVLIRVVQLTSICLWITVYHVHFTIGLGLTKQTIRCVRSASRKTMTEKQTRSYTTGYASWWVWPLCQLSPYHLSGIGGCGSHHRLVRQQQMSSCRSWWLTSTGPECRETFIQTYGRITTTTDPEQPTLPKDGTTVWTRTSAQHIRRCAFFCTGWRNASLKCRVVASSWQQDAHPNSSTGTTRPSTRNSGTRRSATAWTSATSSQCRQQIAMPFTVPECSSVQSLSRICDAAAIYLAVTSRFCMTAPRHSHTCRTFIYDRLLSVLYEV